MPGPGRPSLYTDELAARICERLAAGETLRSICRDEDMPPAPTVCRWALEPPFSEQYARARNIGYDLMADEILDIADDGTNDWMARQDGGGDGWQINGEHIQRSRLRVDSRKWLLSKALPKKYGDKVQHAGDPDAPINVVTEIRRVIVRAEHQDG